eukprot:4509188-Prymnesium_polylepis.1
MARRRERGCLSASMRTMARLWRTASGACKRAWTRAGGCATCLASRWLSRARRRRRGKGGAGWEGGSK